MTNDNPSGILSLSVRVKTHKKTDRKRGVTIHFYQEIRHPEAVWAVQEPVQKRNQTLGMRSTIDEQILAVIAAGRLLSTWIDSTFLAELCQEITKEQVMKLDPGLAQAQDTVSYDWIDRRGELTGRESGKKEN